MRDKGSKTKYYAVLSIVVLAIALYAVFGGNGFADLLKFRSERDKLSAQHTALTKENASLSREIEFLKKDKRYIEKTAREELGMVGKNEIVYKKEADGPATAK